MGLGGMRRAVGTAWAGEALGRLPNLLLPAAVAWVWGASGLTDGLFLALAVAFFLYGSLGNALTAVLTVRIVRDGGPVALGRIVPPAAAAAAVVGLAGTVPLARAGVPGSAWGGVWLAAMSFSSLLAACAAAERNATGRFFEVGASWGLRIVPIAWLVLARPGPERGLTALLAALAMADVTRAVWLMYRARSRLAWRHGGSSMGGRQAVELMVANAVSGLAPLVLRGGSAVAGPGAVTLYELAERIYGTVCSAVSLGVGSVLLVHFSARAERRLFWLRPAAAAAVVGALLWASAWLAMAVFGTSVAEAGAGVDVASLERVTLWLFAGAPAFMAILVLSRALVGARLTAPMPWLALAGVVLAGLGAVALVPGQGIAGAGMAYALSQYGVAALMVWRLAAAEGRRRQ